MGEAAVNPAYDSSSFSLECSLPGRLTLPKLRSFAGRALPCPLFWAGLRANQLWVLSSTTMGMSYSHLTL